MLNGNGGWLDDGVDQSAPENWDALDTTLDRDNEPASALALNNTELAAELAIELNDDEVARLEALGQFHRIPAVASGIVTIRSSSGPVPVQPDRAVSVASRPQTASGREAAWSAAEVRTAELEQQLMDAVSQKKGPNS